MAGKSKKGFWRHVRRRMLSGLVLIVPLAATAFAAKLIYDMVDRGSGPILDRLSKIPAVKQALDSWLGGVPGVRFILTALITALALYLLGLFSTALLVRRAYALGERALLKVPLLRDVYGVSKQVVEMATNEEKPAFKQMALFEFPRPGMYAMGFITGQTREPGPPARVLVHVLMPLAPIPTQLFLFLVPADEVRVLQFPIETALKFLMSGGSVSPGQFPTAPYDPDAPSPADAEE